MSENDEAIGAAPTVKRDLRRARPLAVVGAGAALRLIATGLSAVVGLATTAIAVRSLGVDSYGRLALSLSTMVLVSSLVRLGLEAGTTRLIAAHDESSTSAQLASDVHAVYSLTFWSGIVGAICVAAILWAIHQDLSSGTRVALSLGTALLMLGTNYVAATFSIARGLSRVAIAEVPYLSSGIGKLLVVAILAIAGLSDVAWVALGYGGAGIISAAICIGLARRLVGGLSRLFGWSFREAVRLVPSFLPYAMAALASYTLSRLDVLVLGIAESSRAVGVYEPTLKLTEQLMILVPVLFGSQFLPVATRMSVGGRDEDLRRLFAEVTKLGYVLGMPAVLLLAAFPRSAISTVYGSSFELHPEVVWILLGGFAANLVGGPNLGALIATGHRKALLSANLAALVAVLALALVLIPPFGIKGAALATASSFVVLNLLVTASLWRVKRIHPYSRDVLITFVTAVAPIAAVFGLRSVVADESLLIAASISLSVWAAWVLGLLAARLVRLPEFKDLPFVQGKRGL